MTTEAARPCKSAPPIRAIADRSRSVGAPAPKPTTPFGHRSARTLPKHVMSCTLWAIPLGGPEQPPDLAAVAIDQERRRDAGGRELARRRARLIDEDAERLQPKLLVEALDGWQAAAIDRERQDDELRSAELGLQALERRHLAAARHAPRR